MAAFVATIVLIIITTIIIQPIAMDISFAIDFIIIVTKKPLNH